jgi:hypothetical protein
MQPPGHSHFRKYAPWLFWGAVAVAVLAVIVATQLTASRRAAKIAAPGAHIVVPFTGFGGYNWSGRIANIAAQWSVPRIASDSPLGGGATWIGVQNDVNNQFVQVGIEENDFGDGPNQYQAFWSDLQVGFSPQNFGEVYPGDVISVSMTRSDRGWSLRFDDLSRKLKGKVFVKLAPSVPFTQGEWIQEDPTSSTDTSQDLPYPHLSTVAFQDLKVNNQTPVLNLRDGQVLIASDGTIGVPTPIVADSFSLVAPSGDELQYLDDEQNLDAALNKFDVQLAAWNAASVATKASDATTLSQALISDARALASQRWPASSRSAVAQLIQSVRTQLNYLTSWSIAHYDTRGIAFSRFQLELNRNVRLADALRATLGLPPL